MSNNKPLPKKPHNSKRFLAEQFALLETNDYCRQVFGYENEDGTIADEIRNKLIRDHGANIHELKDYVNDYGGNINNAVTVLCFLGY